MKSEIRMIVANISALSLSLADIEQILQIIVLAVTALISFVVGVQKIRNGKK